MAGVITPHYQGLYPQIARALDDGDGHLRCEDCQPTQVRTPTLILKP